MPMASAEARGQELVESLHKLGPGLPEDRTSSKSTACKHNLHSARCEADTGTTDGRNLRLALETSALR